MHLSRRFIHWIALGSMFILLMSACNSTPTPAAPTQLPLPSVTIPPTSTALPSATFTIQPSNTIVPSPTVTSTLTPTSTEIKTITPSVAPTFALNSPGHYYLARCAVNYNHQNEDYVYVCISAVDVQSDGKLVFNVSLTYQTKPDPNSPTGFRSPTRLYYRNPFNNYQRVYLKDNTGKIYYMNGVTGFPTSDFKFELSKPIYGTFSFERAASYATQFTFYEEDDNVEIGNIVLNPQPAGTSTGKLTSTPSITSAPGPNSPGVYMVGRCLVERVNLQQVEFCLTTVEVRPDGKMAFNVRQTFTDLSIPANSPPNSQSNTILDRKGFWYTLRVLLKDDLGNKYFLNSVEGIFAKNYRLYDNTPVYGSFIFEPAAKYARAFTFFDQDDSLIFESITLNLQVNP